MKRQKFNENIVTVATSEGMGAASISIHPDKAVELIKDGVKWALEGDLSKNKVELPNGFILEIGYKHHGDAYKNSFYPGATQNSPKSILFKTDDYFEIMRVTSFVV